MNNMPVYADFNANHLVFFGEHCVQAIERDRDLWFLLEDLGRMLELKNIRYNLRELKDDEKDWCYKWVEPSWPDPFKGREATKLNGATVYEALPSETGDPAVSKTYSRGQENAEKQPKTGDPTVTNGYSWCQENAEKQPETGDPTVSKTYSWCQENAEKQPKTGDPAVTKSYSRGQNKKVRVVNEAGLYRLVMMSRTPAAEAFKDLVVREILPAIRKTGQYKRRKTTPLAFMPKSMSGLQKTRINMRERPRPLMWIKPQNVTKSG
jgi:prophage antirepressor-like protein